VTRIVIDTSVVIAILAGEAEKEAFVDLLLRSEPVISAGSLVEALRTVQLRFGAGRLGDVHAALAALGVATIPVDADQVRLAQDGMVRFCKGRAAEPAVLNFGDLFAYALARQLSAPLLYKGADFDATDIASAARSP
jgi:ribonuclease VapC